MLRLHGEWGLNAERQRETNAKSRRGWLACSGLDQKIVHDVRHARCRPGGTLCGPAFRPRPDRASQRDLSAIDQDLDVTGVAIRLPPSAHR